MRAADRGDYSGGRHINHGSFRCKYGARSPSARTDSPLFNYFHFNPWTNPDENKAALRRRIFIASAQLYNWVQSDGHNHPHGPPDFENADYHSDPQVRMLHGEPRAAASGRRSASIQPRPPRPL